MSIRDLQDIPAFWDILDGRAIQDVQIDQHGRDVLDVWAIWDVPDVPDVRDVRDIQDSWVPW